MFHFIRKIGKIKLPFLSSFDICVDMGTSNTRIAVKDKGIVLRESTFLGMNTKTKDYLFFGDEARMIMGKTPEFIKIVRPMTNGVICDFDAYVAFMKKMIEKATQAYLSSYRFLKPSMRVITAVPYISTEIERKAVEEVFLKIGFSRIHTIEKAIVIGSSLNIDVFSHQPRLIVDLGGGLIEITIISGGGIVTEKTTKNAGEQMNHIIANYIYLKYGMIIGENTCEELKTSLLHFEAAESAMIVRGKSLENGLPKSIRLKSSDIKEALMNNFLQIVDLIKEVIEISPPEVIDEVYEKGIVLAGGLAEIKGIDLFLSKELKLEVIIPDQPSNAVILGLLSLLNKEESIMRLVSG